MGRKPSLCLCKKNRVVIKLILYDKYSLARFSRFHDRQAHDWDARTIELRATGKFCRHKEFSVATYI